MRAVLLISLLITCSIAHARDAVYRDGSPVIVEPRQQTERPSTGESQQMLREVLRDRGGPRFVVMWNRDLSDRVATRSSDLSVSRGQISATGRSIESWSETERGTRVDRQEEATPLPEDEDWEIRSTFEAWLLEGGMTLVDRNAAIRIKGMANQADLSNLQKIEMEAIAKHADFIVSVTPTSADGPAGARFRIGVIDAHTGQKIVAFSSTGEGPAVSLTRYEASDQGYRKVTDQAVTTVSEIGENLASELAEKLVRMLPRI